MRDKKQTISASTRGRRRLQWAPHALIALLAFALGTAARQREPTATNIASVGDSATSRVTGIGGVFFKSDDRAAILNWYRAHLGISSEEWGGFAYQWRDLDQPDEIGYTVWSVYPATTSYFSPSEQPFMINFRVANLTGLIAALRDAGVEVVGELEEHPNGKFAWILDPEGRKIELWEPVASSQDPYLKP